MSGGAGVRPELGLCPAAVPLVPPREGRGGWGGRRRGPAEAALTWSGRRPDPQGLGLPGAPRLSFGGLSPPRPLGGWRPGSVQAGMWWQYDLCLLSGREAAPVVYLPKTALARAGTAPVSPLSIVACPRPIAAG